MILLSNFLKCFIVTAEEESLKAAASRLFITPPPLCRTLKIFEDNVGSKLFTRTKSGLKLTPDGHDLYEKLMPLYQEALLIEKKYSRNKKMKTLLERDLKIGVDHQEHTYLLPMLTSEFFKTTKSNILLEYFKYQDFHINEIINRDVCTVFFSSEPHDYSDDVFHVELHTGTIKLAVATRNVDKKKPSTSYLSSNTLAYYHQSPEVAWREVNKFIKENQFPSRKIRVLNIDDLLSMIESGDVVGIVPEYIQSIITSRNYKITLLTCADDEHPVDIVRHVYFHSKNKDYIEKNLLPHLKAFHIGSVTK